MSGANWGEFVLFGVLIAISTPLLGNYMYKVYKGGKAPGDRFFLPIENTIYRVCRIDADGEQRWGTYTIALLAFSLAGVLLSYVVLRFQAHLPLNHPVFQRAQLRQIVPRSAFQLIAEQFSDRSTQGRKLQLRVRGEVDSAKTRR